MQVHENYSLQKYNTFHIDAKARYFSTFSSREELAELLDKKPSEKKFILGGGSNVLFTKDFNGFVLKNEIPGIDMLWEDDQFVYIRAGAGVLWHSFVTFCVNNNFAGVENLSLIPGHVGASPMQNIGAYGVEIKDVFWELEAFHLTEKTVQPFKAEDCAFGYRESIFKNKYKDQFAILNVTYRLKKVPDFNIAYGAIESELENMEVNNLTIKAISDAVISIRTSKLPDPAIIGNAGSFFKNPVVGKEKMEELKEKEVPNYPNGENYKIPAGWLIEQCGWKGFRRDDAGCYDKQALVLVNYGKASGKEIYDLSEEIKISVKEKFGIELEKEVNIF
ncbi:MAG TPA: UDP-N-acetylmuramate dehydrogenase [Hanamia sp.]|nr:UDP-N-acetylmuramate dehydrogenase [Hanamia sp.]